MILNRDRLALLTDQWGRFRSLSLASPITPTVGPGDDGFLWMDIGVDGTPSNPIWKMWDEEATTWRQIASPAAWDVITGKPATFDPTLANPSAVVGLTAVNGAATTAIRSDGAPALDQAIAPTWSGVHTFQEWLILSGVAKGIKGVGANVPDIGTTTAAEKWGNIYQALLKDIYPRGDLRGLATRFINQPNFALTDEFHFRTGVIPAGYAWLNDGTFSGDPDNLNYNWRDEYLEGRGSGAGTRHFMWKAITNAAASWQNLGAIGRFTTGYTTKMGLRIDVGNDTEYAELYADGTAADGTISISFRHRIIPAGGPTVVTTNIEVPIDTFFTLFLLCYWTGTAYYYNSYIYAEHGRNNYLIGLGVAASVGTLPCAGRAGLMIMDRYSTAHCDWFWSTFT